MIDLNDRFTGLMIGILVIILFLGYIAIFGEVAEEKKHKTKSPR